MTSNVELLPLPTPHCTYSDHSYPSFKAKQMTDYASACVEHHTEALRAEVEMLRVSSFANATVHIGVERDRMKARAERLAEAINAVLADMSEWGEPAKGAHILRVINSLSMALHPTAAQEAGND